jgi:glucokinase
MNAFARNYTSDVAELLRNIPVYMVLDYEVSLYGAAYIAAHNLYMEDQ